MTIYDLRCDRCGISLIGLAGGGAPTNEPADACSMSVGRSEQPPAGQRGVRFRYHPPDRSLGDDAGLVCMACWERLTGRWSVSPLQCAACGVDLADAPCVSVLPYGELLAWRLCRLDAVTFLNQLRTVEPKLDQDTFVIPS